MVVERDKIVSIYNFLAERDDFVWSVSVDPSGQIRPGKPGPNHIAARPPVEVTFDGTVETEGAEVAAQNSKKFEKALFEISQSTDCRALLRLANHMGYSFQFDTQTCSAIGAAGLCRSADKTIVLSSKMSARDLASTLIHELKHMHRNFSSDIAGGMSYEPKAQIQISSASEADARVWELVGAYQIFFGDSRGPSNQYRSDFLVREIEAKNPQMAQKAHEAQETLSRGFTGVFAAHVFPAYFEMKDTRKFYLDLFHERAVIKKSLKDLGEEWSFKQSVDPQAVLGSVKDLHGMPYMVVDDRVGLDLSDPSLTGMTPFIARNLKSLQNTRRLMNPNLRDEPDWDLPVLPSLIEKPRNLISLMLTPFRSVMAVKGLLASPSVQAKILGNDPNTVASLNEDTPLPSIHIPADEDVVHQGAFAESAVMRIQRYRQLYEEYLKERHSPNAAASYAVDMIDRDYKSAITTWHGTPMNLVDAGFRAPSTVFPHEYILHLLRRLDSFNPQLDTLDIFRPSEIELFEHWLKLDASDKEGVDMIVGDSEYAKNDYEIVYDQALQKFLHEKIKPILERQPLQVEPPLSVEL